MQSSQAAIRSDAASALTALYEEHGAAAFRYALHLTGRREDAEDVIQHVFLQAYRTLESGTTLMSPRAWLMKAAKHRSLNVIRDRREQPMDELIAEVPAHAVRPEEAEELAAVRSMLWTLPENQHSAFVLRHWSGLSQVEIADVLDTTESAVESLLIRARTALVDESADPRSECRTVRDLLIRSVPLAGRHTSHIENCRRCRTARARVLRAAEFAAAFTLVPRPHVAHALSAAIPGFGGGAASAAGGGAASTAGGAASTAGGGAAASGSTAAVSSGTIAGSAPLAAAKAGIAAKALVVALAATATVGAVKPIRQPLENLVLGQATAHATTRAAPSNPAASARTSPTNGTMVHMLPSPAAVAAASAGAPKSSHAEGHGPGTGGTHGASHAGGNGGGEGNATGHAPPTHTDKSPPASPPGQARAKTHAPPSHGGKGRPTSPPGQGKAAPAPAGGAGSTHTGPGQGKKDPAAPPPGQAKKQPANTPPGQAKKAPLVPPTS